MSDWRPIETAPTGRKITLHYRNVMGRNRTVFGIHAKRGAIEVIEDDDQAEEIDGAEFLPQGWWEIVESPSVDYCYVELGANPTHWMPLPEPPEAQ